MKTHWIVENKVDPKWSINTRANVSEVFPEVMTPLTYYLSLIPGEKGWRQSFDVMGVMHPKDIDREEPLVISAFGGYSYLNLSYLRMAGVRAPGQGAEAIDVSLFGEGNPPPYKKQPGDNRPWNTFKMLRYMLGVLATKSEPAFVEETRKGLASWQAEQPSLDAPDEELFHYLRRFHEIFPPLFRSHMVATLTGGILTGILMDGASAANKPELLGKLTAAVGDVASAKYSHALYAISKLVRAEPAIAAEFDKGIEGIGARLAKIAEAAEFNAAFEDFLKQYGHRGPNDWEISCRTWENTPELAYASIDVMRKSDHDLTPVDRSTEVEAERQAAAEFIRPHLGFMDKRNFNGAVEAIRHYVRARESTRDLNIQVLLPTRRVFFELARRGAERGGTQILTDVAMLHPFDELPGYVADPSQYLDIIAKRTTLRDRFAAVEPPFFITSQDEVPSIEELEAIQAAKEKPVQATAGTVLEGTAGSAGVARGRARIVLDPSDPAGLEPDDILVAPLTDPSWTPLFLPAAAVVVNVGALMSHAVVVARELGIPCVVAIENASDRIMDGSIIEVDGTTGVVTIIETPESV